MRQKEVLLIIPAYNEEKNIEKVMKQLAQPELADIVDVLDINMQSEGAILMLFRWMRMGSTMCAISRKFTRD